MAEFRQVLDCLFDSTPSADKHSRDACDVATDYPAAVRRVIEQRHPGSVCLFVTGCAGDANTGHSATASMRGETSAARTYQEAARLGTLVADAVDSAELIPSSSAQVDHRSAAVRLEVARVEPDALRTQQQHYAALARTADPSTRALYAAWRDWAEGQLANPGADHCDVCVSLLTWGDAHVVGLPGEPFARVAQLARSELDDPRAIIAGYTNGCPGYLPTCAEYPLGGYEVVDAHRYYGAAGPFRIGSAEALISALAAAGGAERAAF